MGKSNPVPISGLQSGSGSKVNQFVMSRHLSTRNILSKSMHAFFSNLAIDRQTDEQTNAGKRIYLPFVGGNDTLQL